jgi:endonuclease YncB( thermonuclease family)
MLRRILYLLVVAAALLPVAAHAQVIPPAGAEYVASSRGQVYYWVGCDNWRRLAPANLRFFRSAEEASSAGYRPSRAQGCAGPAPLLTTTLQPTSGGRLACVVESITDGDTLRCGGERVRLLLIDAPEMRQGDFGLRSKLALEELAPVGVSILLELDVQQRDRYQRLLAHVFTTAGVHVNRELVRRGYAVVSVYPPNVRYVELMRAAADSARSERRGLWESSAFECLPGDHRAGRC